jgi:hypothetical protein
MQVDTVSITVPDFFASYLMHGDPTGLHAPEVEAVRQAARRVGAVGDPVSLHSVGFRWSHHLDAITGGAECVEVVWLA